MLHKRFGAAVLILAIIWMLYQPEHADADGDAKPSFALELQPGAETGEQLVTISVKEAEDVYAFELELDYDAVRLDLLRAESEMSGLSVEPIRDKGILRFAHTQIGSAAGKSGELKLAVFTFKLMHPGLAEIKLREVKLVDSELAMDTYEPELKTQLGQGGAGKPVLSDLDGHWAMSDIELALETGIVTGYEDGTFRPNRVVSRAEFSVLLSRALHMADDTSSSGDDAAQRFADDASIPSWAKPHIYAAAKAGVITGYEDDTFRSNREVSRTEMTVMAMRAHLVRGASAEPAAVNFADSGQIPAWAKETVASAVGAGLVQGKSGNRFDPLAPTTRAEATVLILNVLRMK